MATNTWDSSVPAGSRLRSLGDDDIRQLKLDIRERLAAEHVHSDGTAITASNFGEARHKLSSIGLLGLLKGLRLEQRSYATSGNITISGKLQIEINGDMCYLNSDTNLAFSGLTASTSYYIYVASPGHETELGAGNLSYSTTAPTYSTAKKGWYNGTSRAIGFFRSDGSSKMCPFMQTVSKYQYLRGDTVTQVLVDGSALSATEITDTANFIAIFGGVSVDLACYLHLNSSAVGALLYLYGGSSGLYTVLRLDTSTAATTIKNYLFSTCALTTSRTIYYSVGSGSADVDISVLGFDLDGSL